MVERRGVLQAVKAIVVALALLCASPAYAVVAHAKSDGGFCGGGRNGNMPSACASTNTTTFTYTPNATGGQILFGMTCAATGGTPSAVSLTASGWTTTQIGGIDGTTTSAIGFSSLFRAYALNTSATTFTVTWTVAGSSCSGFMNDVIDEFSGGDATNFVDNNMVGHNTTGCAGSITPVANDTGVWFFCSDSVTAVAGGYTKGGDDLSPGGWGEWKILTGGAGVSQASNWTTSGNYLIVGATIKPAGAATTNCTRLLLGVGCDEDSR
jgi:hypothetical protein